MQVAFVMSCVGTRLVLGGGESMCLRSAGALLALLSFAVQPLPLDSDPHRATNRPPTCWSQGLADSTLCSAPHPTPDFKRPKPTTVDRELPLTFEINRGQAEAHVKFLARGEICRGQSHV